MTEGAENTSLDGLIRLAFDQLIGEVHVCLPGRIETFNETKRTATVQPMISRRYRGAANATELPVLQDAPVIENRTAAAYHFSPIAPGDPVTLIFADRGIENWLGSSGAAPSEPLDVRKHDFTDALAILGGWPTLKSGLSAVPGAAGILVGPNTKLVLGSEAVELVDLLDQIVAVFEDLADGLITKLEVHVHGAGGSGPPPPGTFAPFQLQLTALKELLGTLKV